MRKHLMFVLALLLVVVIALSGCTEGYESSTIDCYGINVYGIDLDFDIANYDTDNDTVADSEGIWVYAVDGAGNVLADGLWHVAPLGSRVDNYNTYVPWGTVGASIKTPQENPITVEFVSKGNGFLPFDTLRERFMGNCYLADGTFQDGRINRYDAGAPIAVYPYSFGERGMGLRIYAIQDDSSGLLIMEVTPEELAAASGDWELIVANEEYGVQLFKYLDKWQINARADQGKTYVFIFNELNAGTTVNSYTTDPQ